MDDSSLLLELGTEWDWYRSRLDIADHVHYETTFLALFEIERALWNDCRSIVLQLTPEEQFTGLCA